MNDQERLTYRVSEATALLGVSEQHLRNLIRDGTFPAMRLGHRVLISRAKLRALMDQDDAPSGPFRASLRALK